MVPQQATQRRKKQKKFLLLFVPFPRSDGMRKEKKEPQGHLYQKKQRKFVPDCDKKVRFLTSPEHARDSGLFLEDSGHKRPGHPIIFHRRRKKAVICSAAFTRERKWRLINIQTNLYNKTAQIGGCRDCNFDSHANCLSSSNILCSEKVSPN